MSSPVDVTGLSSPEPTSPAAQDIINQIKVEHDEKIAALTRQYDETLEALKSENIELLAENLGLHSNIKRAQEDIQDKEKLLFQVTGGGAPSSREPCFLCGRVGKRYGEEIGERIARQPLRKPVDGESTKWPGEDGPKPIIANRSDGKHILDSIGGFVNEPIPAPDHYRQKNRVGAAWVRSLKGESKPKDKDILGAPVETEDEMYGIEERQNIMTGQIKPQLWGSYGEWYDAAMPDGDYGQGDKRRETRQEWTAAEMELASRPATGPDPWSQVSPAWGSEQTEPVGLAEGDHGGEEWATEKVDENKDHDQGEGTSDPKDDFNEDLEECTRENIKDGSKDNAMSDDKQDRLDNIS